MVKGGRSSSSTFTADGCIGPAAGYWCALTNRGWEVRGGQDGLEIGARPDSSAAAAAVAAAAAGAVAAARISYCYCCSDWMSAIEPHESNSAPQLISFPFGDNFGAQLDPLGKLDPWICCISHDVC